MAQQSAHANANDARVAICPRLSAAEACTHDIYKNIHIYAILANQFRCGACVFQAAEKYVRAGNARAGMAGSAAAALVGPLAQSLADPHGGGRGVHHRGRTQLFGLRAGRGRAAQGAAY